MNAREGGIYAGTSDIQKFGFLYICVIHLSKSYLQELIKELLFFLKGNTTLPDSKNLFFIMAPSQKYTPNYNLIFFLKTLA